MKELLSMETSRMLNRFKAEAENPLKRHEESTWEMALVHCNLHEGAVVNAE